MSGRVAGPGPRLWLLAALSALLLGACREAGREVDSFLRLAPDLLSRAEAEPGESAHGVPKLPSAPALPPRQPTSGYDFEAAGQDERGWPRYRVRIQAGGSPALVALEKLTPLFLVDGKDGPTYVAEAYFQANPGRTPSSIQPGDEFLLVLPPDTFVVRWQEEREQDLGQPVRLREYVSERGDRLIYYLSGSFPLVYDLRSADDPWHSQLRLHPDLAYLLGSGQIDPLRLARLVYQVERPDSFQVAQIRQVVTEVEPGRAKTLEIDRSRTYLDPVREAFEQATAVEPVAEPGRTHLSRAVFKPEQNLPYLALEDALATQSDLSEIPDGQVFRIEYLRDGTVKVAYKTNQDDARGKRDPYLLRENDRWTALYARLDPAGNTPVKWGPGHPSDLAPFPTARDPFVRNQAGQRAFDYLQAGRALLLTFSPTRSRSELRAELEFQALIGTLRDRYQDGFEAVRAALEARLADETRRPATN
jgi:hypothetical protein